MGQESPKCCVLHAKKYALSVTCKFNSFWWVGSILVQVCCWKITDFHYLLMKGLFYRDLPDISWKLWTFVFEENLLLLFRCDTSKRIFCLVQMTQSRDDQLLDKECLPERCLQATLWGSGSAMLEICVVWNISLLLVVTNTGSLEINWTNRQSVRKCSLLSHCHNRSKTELWWRSNPIHRPYKSLWMN